jgi:hypothetical protein
MVTGDQRAAVTRALDRVRKMLAFYARVWPDARMTESGRHVTARVVVGMTETQYAAWRRSAVPLPRVFSYHRAPAPWEYHWPHGVAIDWPRPGHPGFRQRQGRGLRTEDR